jgi:NAD(P)-dependent dehydrogenase (short-subunit alcohol dehydrogenase family)
MVPKGKTALVTGGARRLGKAIVLALAQAGANVVINYHTSEAEAQATAAEAEALGAGALALQADIANPEQVMALVAAATARFGPVDILINSASHFAPTPFPSGDLSNWRRVLDTQIDGALNCANAVAPSMLRQAEGVIVNMLDIYAWQPLRSYGAHAVGKAALLALTRQLALELAPHVRVNAVAPGRVLQPDGYPAERIARGAARTLLGRWGTPQDVTDAVLYLIRANFITGETIVVDGGERLGRS